MKRTVIHMILVISGLLTGVIHAHQFTISKVGEWGTGAYNNVFVKGNYAYCAAGYAGLDIINVANPTSPKKVGNFETPGYVNDVTIKGNYAYAADGSSGLRIIDITSPVSPKSIGECDTPGYGNSLYVYGNYAYIADGSKGLQIIDVSVPSSPTLVGNFPTPYYTTGVYVVGNYAYVIMGGWHPRLDKGVGGLIILDISNPASPQQLGTIGSWYANGICVVGNYAYITARTATMSIGGLLVIDVTNPVSPVHAAGIKSKDYFDIDIKGNYAYCSCWGIHTLDIIDISIPTSPIIVSGADLPGKVCGIHIGGNYAYVADGYNGLKVFDVSEPTNPFLTANYSESGYIDYLCVIDNYAYTSTFSSTRLQVINISTPSSPTLVGKYEAPIWGLMEFFVKGKYAYAAYAGAFRIIDISDPTSPALTGTYEIPSGWNPAGIYVYDNYAYVANRENGLEIFDITIPSAPSLVKSYNIYGISGPEDVYVKGKYAYTLFYNALKIIDISTPGSPAMVGSIDLPNSITSIFVSGNYAYVASYAFETNSLKGQLYIVNVTTPASPSLEGEIALPESPTDVYVSGNYAYVTCGLSGLKVINISKPASPTLAAGYDTSGPAQKVNVKDNYIYVANGESGKLLVLRGELLPTPPHIHLNHSALDFAATDSGTGTVAIPQTIFISNTGEGVLEWSISEDQQWLNCSPTNGTNSGEVTVSVDAFGLSAGTYTGEIIVSAPDADNSPQKITVTLKVYDSGQTSFPFGQFDTPIDNSTVSGSIPVTGWVLDDIGVQNVRIFREEQDSMVYIGNAVFVEGARPDVEQAYPGYPMNYKAGWGYMLLTNFLPGGNGTFTLYAFATDAEGNITTLGTKTIIVDNAHAVKPFGTIDTPTPGGIVSGRNCPNFGWVLTPQPNTVPIDGSTIHVWVDGLQLGSPVYNLYREDIASFFPGYNNSAGAVGYFNLDTTRFTNGVHTICWTAADDAGNSEGIGSRYFSIQNTGPDGSATGDRDQGTGSRVYSRRGEPACSPVFDRCSSVIDRNSPVAVSKGYDKDTEPQQIYPDRDGNIRVRIKELERVVIQLKDEQAVEMKSVEYFGYLAVGSQLKPLPIGSTMDIKKGIFYWHPGPGFIGRYRLVFIKKDSLGQITRKNIIVTINPKFP